MILSRGTQDRILPAAAAGFLVGEEQGGVRFFPGAASGFFAGEIERGCEVVRRDCFLPLSSPPLPPPASLPEWVWGDPPPALSPPPSSPRRRQRLSRQSKSKLWARCTGLWLKAPGHYSALPSASTPRGMQRKTGSMFRGTGWVCDATRIRLCPAHPPRGGCNGKRARCCEARVGVRGDTVVKLAEGDRSLTLMEFAMRNHSPSSAQRVRVNPGPSEGNSVRGALSATDPRADRLNFGCALKPSSGTTPGQLPSERGDWCSSTGQALSHFAVRKGSTRGLSPGTNKQGHTQACKHFSKRATGRKEPFRSRAPGKPRGNQDETK